MDRTSSDFDVWEREKGGRKGGSTAARWKDLSRVGKRRYIDLGIESSKGGKKVRGWQRCINSTKLVDRGSQDLP